MTHGLALAEAGHEVQIFLLAEATSLMRKSMVNAILDEASSARQTLQWVEAATNGMPLLTRRVIPITTEEYPTSARRPAYSVLSTARLYNQFGVRIPPWRTELQSMFTPNALGDRPAL
jgi:dTDP-4-dehydrorhamnose reductase